MGDLRSFNEECLAAHNGLRNAHNVGPLAYDEKLAKAAQQYAEKLASMRKLEHSQDSERPNQGENLAFCSKPFVNYRYSGRGATASWYSEIKDYDFTKEAQKPGNPATGHFTQVMWKECKTAGFGRAQSSDKGWFVVGRYSPPGNLLGNYMNNIPKSNYKKWEDAPVILEYLEELRTWEFTRARKHILDDWSSETKGSIKNGVKSFTLTENFKSEIYGNYSETATFDEDPSDEPRPEFVGDGKNDFPNNEDDNFPSGDEDEESFAESVVRRHNHYRDKHNVSELHLDDSLTKLAQNWAEQLSRKNKTELSNSKYKGEEVGENITMKEEEMNSKTGEHLVDNWYKEIQQYSFQQPEPTNFKQVGHFTQVIWQGTDILGVGCAANKSGQNFIVCFYYPSGNVKNKFEKNVLPTEEEAKKLRGRRRN